MSLRRIFGITAFGILFIAAVIGVMLLASYLSRDVDPIPLPSSQPAQQPDYVAKPDALDRVEITPETVQAAVAALSRPEKYRREITIEIFWEDGHATYHISSDVDGGFTSMLIKPPDGAGAPADGDKHIIVSAERLYIWYDGDESIY